jgi:dienelactone hydrolase
MSANTAALEGWEKSSFTAATFTRDTYRRGAGPVVIVVHEIPGITPAVEQFANEVVEAGFTVAVPKGATTVEEVEESMMDWDRQDQKNGNAYGS